MKTKNVTVVVSRPPDFATAEKLRMAVGLTLDDGNKVTALFIDEGVCAVNGAGFENHPSRIEVDKSLETLGLMGVRLLAHAPSLEIYGVGLERYNVFPIDGPGSADLLAGSDVIIN
jgi:hypothetical protein